MQDPALDALQALAEGGWTTQRQRDQYHHDDQRDREYHTVEVEAQQADIVAFWQIHLTVRRLLVDGYVFHARTLVFLL
ncbi:hypothetical protein D3C84_1026610 [compost metagenome]